MRRTIIGKQKLTGRGALSNPPGRFDLQQLAPVDDGWYLEDDPGSVATTLEPEKAREIINSNDSPDIPFERSINPYRGCEHACIYCVGPDTAVSMADGSTREISRLQIGDWIYGTVRRGRHRHYEKTRVLARWGVIKPAYRVTLADTTQLTVGSDHRFLTERGWKFITGTGSASSRRPHLTIRHRLMGTGALDAPVLHAAGYREGYLCGLARADGTTAGDSGVHPVVSRRDADPRRPALRDPEALERVRKWLSCGPVETRQLALSSTSRRPVHALRTATRADVEEIAGPIAWPESPAAPWQAGFLAALFDTAGSYSGGILRIATSEPATIRRLSAALAVFAFRFVVEHRTREDGRPTDEVRIAGGLYEHLRFFHTVDPAVTRKRDISGQIVKSMARLEVVEIEPLNEAMRLIDITTGTGDYISNGVVSHNCYARPSHAYMGLSPGLDFETRLFYKEDAAALLEKQLARKSYVCKSITLGANTDPYQPVERRMNVTRSILEVLVRTRHPVSIITKSALVLRDLDLLTQLARQGLTTVSVSITTLDAELKRTLEPRAASPQARLRTVAALSAAGVPCAVMVAPVIPVLTDHDMEGILEASAQAGALWAGYVLVRLPYEIKDLFREWLAEHYPLKAAHVMSLVQDMRGGKDNDPRFGSRMRGTGPYAELLRSRFRNACRRFNLNVAPREGLSTALFTAPTLPGAQLGFDL